MQSKKKRRKYYHVAEKAGIAIACGKSWCRSAMITGLRMPREIASTLSMARHSAYGSTWAFQDMQGNELAAIQEKIMLIKDTYCIYRNGNVLATVKKALVAPLRQRFDIHVAGAENMEAEGNILDHEYEIHEGRSWMAEVSKKWFRVVDTYGVDIVPGADDVLILAIT